MRVLITGGAGFIGSAIAHAYVARGADVTVVDNLAGGRRTSAPPDARFVQADICECSLEEVFKAYGPFDVVSHHAALKDVRRALIDPRPDAQANILGTLNVLRCAADSGTRRFIYPSSAAIYGEATQLPTPETAPLAPISPYGISKAAAEGYCAYFAHRRSVPAVSLRYACVYGPAAAEESESGVIRIFARAMIAGRRPAIYGDGEQTRDFVHVDDVVRANLLAAENAPQPWAAYNVASGVETPINGLYRVLARRAGFHAPPTYEPEKPGELRRHAQDASLIGRELGWRPQRTFEAGLDHLVDVLKAEG